MLLQTSLETRHITYSLGRFPYPPAFWSPRLVLTLTNSPQCLTPDSSSTSTSYPTFSKLNCPIVCILTHCLFCPPGGARERHKPVSSAWNFAESDEFGGVFLGGVNSTFFYKDILGFLFKIRLNLCFTAWTILAPKLGFCPAWTVHSCCFLFMFLDPERPFLLKQAPLPLNAGCLGRGKASPFKDSEKDDRLALVG